MSPTAVSRKERDPMKFDTAQAGTLESSDCLVTVVPGEGRSLDYRGGNAPFFRSRTERILAEVLDGAGIRDVGVTIQDQGALEATLRARIETALERAARGGDRA
jgi:citrate lyase subunit gamma (acyl carrier protein)